MGNNSSKKRKDWNSTKQYSTDVEPTQRRSLSPCRRAKSAGPREVSFEEVLDVPGKPGKAIVTLTNLQSDKPSGSCVTDSIYLDWKSPIIDGGRQIQGYSVEMYDLPTGNWVCVTQTEGDVCRSMLDNILCGIMYRFRVRAFNEVGTSVPGIPSDSFVIDTPGVHIAPYFILCPPPEVSKLAHDTVQFRAKALGTPTPNILWQKDEEPIFVTQGIDIQDEPDGSLLTVHNLQLDDTGVIECVAVNHVGKAIAATSLRVISAPTFNTANIPLQFSFRNDDMVRLKFPLEAQPYPELILSKENVIINHTHCQAIVRDGLAIVKIDSAQESDSGSYRLDVDNGYGKASLEFSITVEVPPLAPSIPDILDVAPSGELTLAWQPPCNVPVDHYIVEYYRDQWQLWLRMKTCIDSVTVITDLIPGSKYKFRVMAASVSGISEPSPESEEVMIGVAAEDELFDLPRGRPRDLSSRGRPMLNNNRKMPSFDRASLDRHTGARGDTSVPPGRRHTSLDREVYYDSNNIRRDVVTYKPPELDKIGGLTNKYKLSNEELAKYRMSMSELCHRMKAMSNSSLTKGSRVSLDTATKPLQMEITNQARKSNSMGQLWSHPHIEKPRVELGKFQSKASSTNFLAKRNRVLDETLSRSRTTATSSGDIHSCRQSLTDIRDRIGSLQSLLKTSRNLTSSKQRLFADLPTFNIPVVEKKKPAEDKQKLYSTHRNDSYANAIEADPVVEHFQETHFPYNPAQVSLGSLECDKFPQEPGSKRRSLFLTECENDQETEVVNQTVSNFFSATIRSDSQDEVEDDNNPAQKDSGEGRYSTQDETSPRCAASQKHNDQQNLDHDDLHQQYLDDPDDEPSQSLDDPDDLSISTQSHTIQCSSNSDTLPCSELHSSISETLQQRSFSSCSQTTLIGSPKINDEYMLESESLQTLLVERSMSACSQGTLVADSTSLDDLELD